MDEMAPDARMRGRRLPHGTLLALILLLALAVPPRSADASTGTLHQAGRPPLPTVVVSRFLAALRADPSGRTAVQYLDEDLGAAVRSGHSVVSLLGLQALYRSFSVVGSGPESDYTSHTGVRATLVYPSGSIQRDFELRVNPNTGVWRIDRITPVAAAATGASQTAEPAIPAAGEGGASATEPAWMLVGALLLGLALPRGVVTLPPVSCPIARWWRRNRNGMPLWRHC
jgi:hypothetical protein